MLCWSNTRRHFKLTPEVPEDDPFVTCGRPVPLGADECAKLSKEIVSKDNPDSKYGPVLSGYYVPVVVSESLSDGRQLELGLFERRVTLKSDPDVEPITITVRPL